jgi:hypothetical protein
MVADMIFSWADTVGILLARRGGAVERVPASLMPPWLVTRSVATLDSV